MVTASSATSPTRAGSSSSGSTPASWSCSRAPRARCSTSTTARIRSSPRRTRSRAPRASAPASAPRTSTRSGESRRPTATRVGAGPFPTELDGRAGATRSASGAASTGRRPGRARRVGWLDLVALRYAARLNSLTALAMTKLDVLSGFDRLARLHALPRRRGRRVRPLPLPPDGAAPRDRRVRGAARLVARTSPSAAAESELPAAAREYLQFIARVRRRADRADRRRPGPRGGDLDPRERRNGAALRRSPEPAAASLAASQDEPSAPVLEQVLVGHLTNDPRGHAQHDLPRRDVTRHDRARRDERLLADLDPGREHRPAADPAGPPEAPGLAGHRRASGGPSCRRWSSRRRDR